MRFLPTRIPEVVVIEPQLFGDSRGFFMETWHARKFAAAGLALAFVQDNHSKSSQGTLRGLHYQIEQPQGKLVRVISGEVFDVAVDLRRSSPTFGQWVGERLSAENKRMLW
ncbi:MAG TPA: dTDP-4-dehydrorhamnose 3,5-epimerase, partial [Desulfurivibrionaceae bacterium]|nr:dTDP-4-dehydrorhamnose 3,5-epimerase [Desulfurivibrionaceae bacterium]